MGPKRRKALNDSVAEPAPPPTTRTTRRNLNPAVTKPPNKATSLKPDKASAKTKKAPLPKSKKEPTKKIGASSQQHNDGHKVKQSEKVEASPAPTNIVVGARRKRKIDLPSEGSPKKKHSPSKQATRTIRRRNVGFATIDDSPKTAVLEKKQNAVSMDKSTEPVISKPSKTAKFSSLPKKAAFSTLSTKLEKLKKVPRLQTKKSLCSKDILNLLDEDKAEEIEEQEPEKEPEDESSPLAEESKVQEPKKRKRITYEKKEQGVKGKRKAPLKDSVSCSPASPRRLSRKSPNKSTRFNPSETSQKNNSLLNKVPIWKKSGNISQMLDDPKTDVFDPNCYGEEEFGPEKDGGKAKKKPRRKKKETKAILVFGDKGQRKNIEKAVKESHHLKTPGGAKKRPAVPQIVVSKAPPPQAKVSRHMESRMGYSSDFSVGGQNYFDSVDQIPQMEVSVQQSQKITISQSTIVTQEFSAQIINPSSLKSYKTPSVPKTFSKLLKNDQSSTPKIEAAKPKGPGTIKDQIQNAFGFDDTDEDDLSGSESMLISPVKKIRSGTSMLEMSNRNPSVSRMSTLHSFRDEPRQLDHDQQHTGPYRFNAVPGRSAIFREIAAMEREKIDRTIARQIKDSRKATRTSPRKKKSHKPLVGVSKKDSRETVPPASVDELPTPMSDDHNPSMPDDHFPPPAVDLPQQGSLSEDQVHASASQKSPMKPLAPKNAFEVLKSARSDAKPTKKVKKLTKKVSKNRQLEQSSIYESHNQPPAKSRKVPSKAKSPTKSTGKENHDELESSNIVVSRTYRKKDKQKPSVSFEQTLQTSPSRKKPTKKEKRLEAWASLQTSHFSEIEEFDISFA